MKARRERGEGEGGGGQGQLLRELLWEWAHRSLNIFGARPPPTVLAARGGPGHLFV
jgi:hypothetical protein